MRRLNKILISLTLQAVLVAGWVSSLRASSFYPIYDTVARTYAWSGHGGYASSYCTGGVGACSMTISGIPAGAKIIDAFVYFIAEQVNGGSGNMAVFFAGTNLNWYGHADTIGDDGIIGAYNGTSAVAKRYNIGPLGANLVTGNGTYSLAGSDAGWHAASMFVLWELASAPCTTIVLGQGCDFAASVSPWANYTLDWSDQNNPVGNPVDVQVEWHAFAGKQGGTPADQVLIYSDPSYSTVAYSSPADVFTQSAGSSVFTVNFNSAGVFNPGQTKAYFGGTGVESGGLYVYSTVVQIRGSGTCDQAVQPPVALTLTKTASPNNVTTGGNVTYSFLVCNNGALATGGKLCTDNFNDSKISGFKFIDGTSAEWLSSGQYVTESGGVITNPSFNDMAFVKMTCDFRSATVCADHIWATDNDPRGMILKAVTYTSKSIALQINCASSGASCVMTLRQGGMTEASMASGTSMGATGTLNLTGTKTICAYIGGGQVVVKVNGSTVLTATNSYIPDTDVGYMGFFSSTAPNTYDNLSVDTLGIPLQGGGLTNVQVWDTIPTGISYSSCTAGCTEGGSPAVVSWSGISLSATACTVLTWTGVVTASGPGSISNTAKYGANEEKYGPYLSNKATIVLPPGTPTNTPTRTNSPSPTPTFSATPTFSSTPSPTPSNTPSPTYTATLTSSPTPTNSPTPTQSFTFTASPTPTATPTGTPTATQSFTFTTSPTPTGTPTATPTYTATSTFSPTPTYSDSPTGTATATPTFSFTPTKTYTDSPTASYTSTPSVTFSGTKTFTDSPTATPSATPSFSFTPTATFSDSPTPSATVTQSFTFTGTGTFTDSPTPTPTFTDTNTPPDSPTASPTMTESASYTESFTFTGTRSPTDSATETPTFTDSATPTETKTPSPTKSETPSKTISPTFSVSPTISATPQALPYYVKVAVYNSAGEQVALLYTGGITIMPGAPRLNGNVVLAGVSGVSLVFDGTLATGANTLAWLGLTTAGAPAKGGVYYINTTVLDSFGEQHVYTAPVSLIEALRKTEINIFNSAGERVYHQVFSNGDQGIGLTLDTDSFSPLHKALNGEIRRESGSVTTWSWDGRNDQGRLVSAGSYTIQLVADQSEGGETKVLRQVLVVAEQDIEDAHALVLDSPLREADLKQYGGVRVRYWDYAVAAGSAKGRLYDLTGRLVSQALVDPNQPGQMVLPLRQAAGGLYFIAFEYETPSGTAKRAMLKVAIIR